MKNKTYSLNKNNCCPKEQTYNFFFVIPAYLIPIKVQVTALGPPAEKVVQGTSFINYTLMTSSYILTIYDDVIKVQATALGPPAEKVVQGTSFIN